MPRTELNDPCAICGRRDHILRFCCAACKRQVCVYCLSFQGSDPVWICKGCEDE